MTPQALVFDAYGTLFDVHAVIARCEQFWPGRGAALSQLWRARQLEYSWQRTLMQRHAPFSLVTRDALAYACAALGLPLDEARTGTLMDAYLNLPAFPDVPAALETLQRDGRKLVILTNGSQDMIEPLVKYHGLEKAFAAILTVEAARTFKPAPAAYALAVDRLGLTAGAIGFVSSNCWDAIGAKSFGFRAFWVNRTGAPIEQLGFQPDGILRTLGELAEKL